MCLGTQDDTISNVSQDLLNETFSSLSLASPAATTYTFDATSLSAAALSTSQSAVSSVGSSRTSSPSSASSLPSPAESHNDSNALSGGTIAGIVVGCVVGIAAIIAAGYIVLRRRQRRIAPAKETDAATKPAWVEPMAERGTADVSELSAAPLFAEVDGGYITHELPTKEKPGELSTQ